VGGDEVIRHYREADGSLRFKNSAVTPCLRRHLERQRLEGERLNAEYEERLFAENMALLGETRRREVTHPVREKTDALWRAW
jgi:hypothetical protein